MKINSRNLVAVLPMETIHFSHFPNQISTLNAAIFHSVPKPEELLDRLLTNKDGNDEEIQFAFVDSTRIISRNHLMTAIHQAMLSATNSMQNKDANGNGMAHSAVKGGMRARNLNAEILWKLSPSSNVSTKASTLNIRGRQVWKKKKSSIGNDSPGTVQEVEIKSIVESNDKSQKEVQGWRLLESLFRFQLLSF